jgi:hypothetical protein
MTVILRRIIWFPMMTGMLVSGAATHAQDKSVTISEPPPIAGSTQPEALSIREDTPPATTPFILKRPADSYADSLQDDDLPDEVTSQAPVITDNTQPEPNTIVLQGLNKVTGHISRLEAPVGTVMRFGNLEVIGRRCWQAPPDEQPENAGLLEIWELKPGESHERIFLGWSFSSSPGLSGLQHPVYDVTVLECLTLSDPEKHEDSDDKTAGTAKETKAKSQ